MVRKTEKPWININFPFKDYQEKSQDDDDDDDNDDIE